MSTNGRRQLVARIARRGLVLATIFAVALVCTTGSRAQLSTPPGPDVKPAAAAANATPAPAAAAKPAVSPANLPAAPAAQAPSKGSHEGIAVHGYWVIDVRNSDGTLAKHLEFENQLCTSFSDGLSSQPIVGGDSILQSLLTGTASAGAWSIVVGAPDSTSASEPNCAIAPYAFLTQQSVFAPSLYGTPDCQVVTVTNNGITMPVTRCYGAVFGFPLATTCQFQNPDGETFVFPGSNYVAKFCNTTLTESTSQSGATITLSAQFIAQENVQISAVGTDLFTCTGTPGPPRPTDCANIGADAVNSLGVANTPCTILGSGGEEEFQSFVNFTGCIPGDTTSVVAIKTQTVSNVPGRAPFSGVVLNGMNGVPAAFNVSAGQTVAVNWTLSFQ